jgi:hypothetical protein
MLPRGELPGGTTDTIEEPQVVRVVTAISKQHNRMSIGIPGILLYNITQY